ncbi:Voltage-dependent anion-selective channel protein 1 [Sciurus carolinensis]|uniref:Non-selective voltage-gated ion channel VDAC1 n=1 Tax=Sciurus carolinensis TaxID=30640 RepID=A0AA41MYB4_SCICA|nr:Voltage-dependent anion-selective channel protein 1 [Sciurus carolinensis]
MLLLALLALLALLHAAAWAVAATTGAAPVATASEQKMAVPLTSADLGKSARDIFTKGYDFSLIKLNLKTKSENGLGFTGSGSANTETTKVTDSLETKYRWTESCLTFAEKWARNSVPREDKAPSSSLPVCSLDMVKGLCVEELAVFQKEPATFLAAQKEADLAA